MIIALISCHLERQETFNGRGKKYCETIKRVVIELFHNNNWPRDTCVTPIRPMTVILRSYDVTQPKQVLVRSVATTCISSRCHFSSLLSLWFLLYKPLPNSSKSFTGGLITGTRCVRSRPIPFWTWLRFLARKLKTWWTAGSAACSTPSASHSIWRSRQSRTSTTAFSSTQMSTSRGEGSSPRLQSSQHRGKWEIPKEIPNWEENCPIPLPLLMR